MKVKFIMALFFFGLAISGLRAQTMYVRPNAGAQSSYAIANIKKLTFSGGNLVVTNLTGANGTFPLSGNRYLNFTNLTLQTAVVNLCRGTTPAPLTTPSGSALKWYKVTGTTTAPIYTLIATGAPSPSTTTVASPSIVYAVSEVLSNGVESDKFKITVNVLALPTEVLGAMTSNTVSATTTTGFVAATLAVGQYVGTTTAISYRIPEFIGSGLSYLWTVPPGVTIVGSSDTNVLTVHYNDVAAGVGTIGAIKVQAVNTNGCAGTAKSITVSKVLPSAPGSIKMTNAAIPVAEGKTAAAITTFAPYMGTDTELTLTAKLAATATSYVWELPTGVNVTDDSATTVDGVTSSLSNVITVNFLGVTSSNSYNYSTTAGVSTNVLRIGVKARNGVGVSVTSNSTLANSSLDFTPNSTSTAKLLTLTAIKPAIPASLAINNGITTTAITVISKKIGQGETVKLLAGTSALASSYLWELPASVTRVTSSTGQTAVTGDDALKSTDPFIYVKFTQDAIALPGVIYFGVKAENGVGSSNSTLVNTETLSPGNAGSTFKLLKLVTAVPAGPATLVLYDVNNGPSTTAVTALGKYIFKTTKLKLTAGASVLANFYGWTLPEGVKRVDVNGNDVLDLESTEPFIYVNFDNIIPLSSTTISMVFGVNAVNNVGPSVTVNTGANSTRTDKLLTVTAGLPAVVATVSGSLSVCDRSEGFSYTITAPAGANYYQITAPVGSVVSSTNGLSSATSTSSTNNVLSTSDLTFKVVYSGTAAFPTTDKSLVIRSYNAFGPSLTTKALVLTKQATCSSLVTIARLAASTEEFKVIAYPNPSSSAFTIETSAKGVMSVSVYDMTGRIIENQQISTNTVEIGGAYTPGVYSVILENAGQSKTIRLIKK